ncbi:MAG TPA: hypothetical protein VJU84_16610 [Pyrinomonadaceae bacterium]|nr:hypothetical protein [Pyrinomonadaceae bacterium]
MEIQNVSAVLADKMNFTRTDIESVHYGEADQQDVQLAYSDPKTFVKAAGIPFSDESQYHITVSQRQDRHSSQFNPKGAATDYAAPVRAARAVRRRVIVIVVHYSCCCGDIFILGW